MTQVRKTAVAGMFYPAVASQLSEEIEQLLANIQPAAKEGELRGLVVPHAGYMYSGATAANSYRLLNEGQFPTVIVVGPSHREYFDGISIYPGDAYDTPLGQVPVDTEIRAELLAASQEIFLSDAGHGPEHAIEVQLPFLQKTLGRFSFVPVVMGDQRASHCRILGNALASVIENRNILLIASSDLSHYHPYDTAIELDRKVIADVEKFDPDALLEKLERHEVEACGGGPMVAVMYAARKLGANTSRVLYYCNSGDVVDKKDAVVGYLSAAFMYKE